ELQPVLERLPLGDPAPTGGAGGKFLPDFLAWENIFLPRGRSDLVEVSVNQALEGEIGMGMPLATPGIGAGAGGSPWKGARSSGPEAGATKKVFGAPRARTF